MIDEETRSFLATNVKGLLADLGEWMEERNRELRSRTRYGSATPAEAKLFATLRGEERSLSELARAIGVSRQAVHRTAHRLAQQGVVTIVAAPSSRRERIVQITSSGEQVQKMAARNLRRIEGEMAATIGRPKLEQLRSLLIEVLENVAKNQDPADAGDDQA